MQHPLISRSAKKLIASPFSNSYQLLAPDTPLINATSAGNASPKVKSERQFPRNALAQQDYKQASKKAQDARKKDQEAGPSKSKRKRKRQSKGKQAGNVHKDLIRGRVESFDFGMHASEQQQGLPAQVKETFHVCEKPNLTCDYSDSFTMEKIDNPTFNNSCFNSQLSSVASGVELLMLKVRYLSREYDALIDSSSSHNFVSQQTQDQLRQLQRDITAVEVEQATGDRLQVVLAEGTSTESKQRT